MPGESQIQSWPQTVLCPSRFDQTSGPWDEDGKEVGCVFVLLAACGKRSWGGGG